MPRWIEPADPPDATRAALGLTGPEWDRPHLLAWGQSSFSTRMPTAVLEAGGPVQPWPAGTPLDTAALRFADPLLGRPLDWDTFLDRRLFNDALMVVHRGWRVHESYRNGFGPADLHVVHSCSKTLTTMMVGIAIAEGRLDPAMPIATCVPALAGLPAWAPVTLQHVLDMAVGIVCDEDYARPDSMYWTYARAVGYAGAAPDAKGALAFVREHLVARSEPPGQRFNYASYLTNLLPLALEHAYGRPAVDLYEQRLFGRLGAEQRCELNADPLRLPLVEGQVNLCLRDFARWAALFAHDGRNLAGEPIVPPAWIEATLAPDAVRRAAFLRSDAAATFPDAQYGNQCWVLEPSRRRFAMRGIHGQFAWFDLPAQLMIVGLGSYPVQTAPAMTWALRTLWTTVGEALADR